MRNDNIRETLIHHESQLTSLNARMGGVESKLNDHGGKLDQIVQAVTAQQARKAMSFHEVLGVARDFAVLVGLAVSAIIYVASGQFSASFAIITERDRVGIERDRAMLDRLNKIDERITQRSWEPRVSQK